jgi:prevent-host-death family protein
MATLTRALYRPGPRPPGVRTPALRRQAVRAAQNGHRWSGVQIVALLAAAARAIHLNQENEDEVGRGARRPRARSAMLHSGYNLGCALMTSECFMTLQKRKSKSSRSSRTPRRKPGLTSKARQPKTRPRAVALAEVKDDLSKFLRLAAEEEIVITRHGRPAGVLIGFASEDDWFDYRLEHHPEFLRRIAEARAALREGRGVALDDIR